MAASTTKRKRGRPRKPDSEKRRNNVTFRIRDSLKGILEESAVDAGRSLSEEIESRLEATLVERHFFGGDVGYEAARLLFAAIKMYENISEASWKDDPDCNLMVRAIADDYFRRWGPSGLDAFEPKSQDLRKLVKQGVSDYLLMAYINPFKDKDHERAHAQWWLRK